MRKKKIMKIVGITVGAAAECGLIALAFIGTGDILTERYHDPEHYIHNIVQCALYGWDHFLNLGWAA